MVTHLNLHRVIDFFFANYKSSVVKNVRSFRVPISSQSLLLVKSFYKANLIYSYTLDSFSKYIIVYPRINSFQNKNFQVIFRGHQSIRSISQLLKYVKSGYSFIIFSPFNKKKFLTSTEFLYSKCSGHLLLLWLNFLSLKLFYARKRNFFPSKRLFFHL